HLCYVESGAAADEILQLVRKRERRYVKEELYMMRDGVVKRQIGAVRYDGRDGGSFRRCQQVSDRAHRDSKQHDAILLRRSALQIVYCAFDVLAFEISQAGHCMPAVAVVPRIVEQSSVAEFPEVDRSGEQFSAGPE